MQSPKLNVVCEKLLFRIFQQQTEDRKGFIVALSSPHPGAGVTQITNALADALRRDEDGFAISLCCRHLTNGDSWHSTQANLSAALRAIRLRYRYALIDCGSLSDAQDIVQLAPLVDGVILVIEANRTQKSQILHAERTIESVNGRILGHVLNKRTYAIPEWCHRAMASVGM